jgi:hypothetical protein
MYTDGVLANHNGVEVPPVARSLGISPVRTSVESPWQNGIAERWVESCRRDLLDQIIPIDERHLKRLLSDYVHCYHEDRTHLGLGKETPGGRIRSKATGRVTIQDRLADCIIDTIEPPKLRVSFGDCTSELRAHVQTARSQGDDRNYLGIGPRFLVQLAFIFPSSYQEIALYWYGRHFGEGQRLF